MLLLGLTISPLTTDTRGGFRVEHSRQFQENHHQLHCCPRRMTSCDIFICYGTGGRSTLSFRAWNCFFTGSFIQLHTHSSRITTRTRTVRRQDSRFQQFRDTPSRETFVVNEVRMFNGARHERKSGRKNILVLRTDFEVY